MSFTDQIKAALAKKNAARQPLDAKSGSTDTKSSTNKPPVTANKPPKKVTGRGR